MQTNGSIFTGVERMLVASTLLFAFALNTIGCKKADHQDPTYSEVELQEAATETSAVLLAKLNAEGINFVDPYWTEKAIEKASTDRLYSWRASLDKLSRNCEQSRKFAQKNGDFADAQYYENLGRTARIYRNLVNEKIR